MRVPPAAASGEEEMQPGTRTIFSCFRPELNATVGMNLRTVATARRHPDRGLPRSFGKVSRYSVQSDCPRNGRGRQGVLKSLGSVRRSGEKHDVDL